MGAISDKSRMPARCCSLNLHPGVAGGILDPSDLERYRSQYEEFCATDRLYCPVQTCSIFLPRRSLCPSNGKVTCSKCAAVICLECKQLALDDPHTCPSRDPVFAVIEGSGFKICPKCETAIERSGGCEQMLCKNCGALWCWGCRRPLGVCVAMRDCRGTRDDGRAPERDLEHTERQGEQRDQSETQSTADIEIQGLEDTTMGSYESDSDIPCSPRSIPHPRPSNSSIAASLPGLAQETNSPTTTSQLPGPLSTTTTLTLTPLTANESEQDDSILEQDDSMLDQDDSTPEQDNSILEQNDSIEQDDSTPDQDDSSTDQEEEDWEDDESIFSNDSEHGDMWGCYHHLIELRRDTIHDQWMVDLDRHLWCLLCWNTINLDAGPARECKLCRIVVCNACLPQLI